MVSLIQALLIRKPNLPLTLSALDSFDVVQLFVPRLAQPLLGIDSVNLIPLTFNVVTLYTDMQAELSGFGAVSRFRSRARRSVSCAACPGVCHHHMPSPYSSNLFIRDMS